MTDLLVRRRNLDTEKLVAERTQHEYEDRDQGDASTSQEKPKVASKPPKAGERHQTVSLAGLEATNPANTLISNFQPLEL